MDLHNAEEYLIRKIKLSPPRSKERADYEERLRRIRNMIAWEPEPPDAA